MSQRKQSKQWHRQHVDDPYVRRAQQQGYRSRAAFKLEEIDQRYHLLRPGMRVVDLGAAPGSWAQYARKKLGNKGHIWALDLLPINPVPGVEILQGDFTDQAVLDLLVTQLQGRSVDLVLSDMAPNISGVATADQAKAMILAKLAEVFSGSIPCIFTLCFSSMVIIATLLVSGL